MHQIPFLQRYGKINTITLAVINELDSYRRKESWQSPKVPDYIKTRFVGGLNSSLELLNESEHVFSGYFSYRKLFIPFLLAMLKKKKVIVISEPFNTDRIISGLKFKVLSLITKIIRNRLFRILCIGDLAEKQFLELGFQPGQLRQWCYLVEDLQLVEKQEPKLGSFVFVGTLNDRKNIVELVKIFESKKCAHLTLTIVGDGPLYKEILERTKYEGRIELLGRRNSLEVRNIIAQHECLILPSKFDGWGAVVNEAFLMDRPVIVSKSCGSSILVKEDLGVVYDELHPTVITDFDYKRYRNVRATYLEKCGFSSVLKYFQNIVDDKPQSKVDCPWL